MEVDCEALGKLQVDSYRAVHISLLFTGASHSHTYLTNSGQAGRAISLPYGNLSLDNN